MPSQLPPRRKTRQEGSSRFITSHLDGDSWDYLGIAPVTTPAQDAALDAAAKTMGINVMRGGIEMRKHVTSHTDTFVRGPTTAAAYLAAVGAK